MLVFLVYHLLHILDDYVYETTLEHFCHLIHFGAVYVFPENV